MREKLSNSFIKQFVAVMFTVAFVLLGVCIGSDDTKQVYAENTFTLDASGKFGYVAYTDKDSVKEYLGSKAPQAQDGYVFAGWYYVENDTKVAIKNASQVDESGATTFYAKYVPEGILSTKVQISTKSTNAEVGGADTRNMRFVSSVDELNYRTVGFALKYQENDSEDWRTFKNEGTYVFSRIVAATGNDEYKFSPKVVDTKSEYFMTATWKGADNNGLTNFDTDYYVRAYWVTMDGVTVYGPVRYVEVNDGLNSNIINVAVKGATTTTEGASVVVSGYEGATGTVAFYDGTSSHVRIDLGPDVKKRDVLKSVTKFTVDDKDVYYRNLYTEYKGTGTEDTSWYDVYGNTAGEYVIATSADLYGLSVITADTTDGENFANQTIYLCADIEANKGTATKNGWDKTHNAEGQVIADGTEYLWTPVGNAIMFNGTFDGQGHIISGIYANESTRTAMFEWTNSQSCIQNFELLNSYFKNTSTITGSIVGRVGGKISNVYSDAIVQGESYGNGGLAGQVYAPNTGYDIQIENCHFAGQVYSKGNMAGGVLGTQSNGKAVIKNCEVSGKVNTDLGYVGGIFGTSYADSTFGRHINVEITDCEVTEDAVITSTSKNAGGFAAYIAQGTLSIENCLFDGKLNTQGYAGGLAGWVAGGTVTIQDCDSDGTIAVNGADYVGGLVGAMSGGSLTMQDSSFGGAVTSANGTHGGFVGGATGGTTLIKNCGSTTDATVTAASQYNQTGGLVGYVTTGTVTINKSSFAGTLNANSYAGGLVGRVVSGTVNIENKSSFIGTLNAKQYAGGFAGSVEGGTVNVSDSSVTGTVVSTGYAGGIVGQEIGGTVSITNNSSFVGTLNTTGQYIGGLVGNKIGGDITIQDCYSSATFSVKDWYAGGLVGAISGGSSTTIENSYFSGSLTGTYYIGGILGNAASSGTTNIKKCYTSGTVTGSGNGIGGILGYITAGTVSMENCLNKGSVTTNDGGAGGLVGRTNGGTVSMKYCLNRGVIAGPHAIGSVVGWKQNGTVTATSVYATKTSTANNSSKTWPYSNVPIGNTNSTTYTGVSMIGLTDITVSATEGITSDSVKTTLADFNFDTIWTIAIKEGSMPELQFN